MIQIDMRLPENCERCPLCHRAFDGNETRLACFGLGAWCYEDDERLDNCPLHEVTEDEDTISREQAINKIRNTFRVLYSGDMISKADAVDILNELPPSPSPSQSRPQIPCKNCTWSDKCKQILHEFCPHEAILKESMKGRTHE